MQKEYIENLKKEKRKILLKQIEKLYGVKNLDEGILEDSYMKDFISSMDDILQKLEEILENSLLLSFPRQQFLPTLYMAPFIVLLKAIGTKITLIFPYGVFQVSDKNVIDEPALLGWKLILDHNYPIIRDPKDNKSTLIYEEDIKGVGKLPKNVRINRSEEKLEYILKILVGSDDIKDIYTLSDLEKRIFKNENIVWLDISYIYNNLVPAILSISEKIGKGYQEIKVYLEDELGNISPINISAKDLNKISKKGEKLGKYVYRDNNKEYLIIRTNPRLYYLLIFSTLYSELSLKTFENLDKNTLKDFLSKLGINSPVDIREYIGYNYIEYPLKYINQVSMLIEDLFEIEKDKDKNDYETIIFSKYSLDYMSDKLRYKIKISEKRLEDYTLRELFKMSTDEIIKYAISVRILQSAKKYNSNFDEKNFEYIYNTVDEHIERLKRKEEKIEEVTDNIYKDIKDKLKYIGKGDRELKSSLGKIKPYLKFLYQY